MMDTQQPFKHLLTLSQHYIGTEQCDAKTSAAHLSELRQVAGYILSFFPRQNLEIAPIKALIQQSNTLRDIDIALERVLPKHFKQTKIDGGKILSAFEKTRETLNENFIDFLEEEFHHHAASLKMLEIKTQPTKEKAEETAQTLHKKLKKILKQLSSIGAESAQLHKIRLKVKRHLHKLYFCCPEHKPLIEPLTQLEQALSPFHDTAQTLKLLERIASESDGFDVISRSLQIEINLMQLNISRLALELKNTLSEVEIARKPSQSSN